MAFPKLTKQEALRLECVRVAPHDVYKARALYEFIVEPAAKKKPVKKLTRKKRVNQ
jgi:hypothetical protein